MVVHSKRNLLSEFQQRGVGVAIFVTATPFHLHKSFHPVRK